MCGQSIDQWLCHHRQVAPVVVVVLPGDRGHRYQAEEKEGYDQQTTPDDERTRVEAVAEPIAAESQVIILFNRKPSIRLTGLPSEWYVMYVLYVCIYNLP